MRIHRPPLLPHDPASPFPSIVLLQRRLDILEADDEPRPWPLPPPNLPLQESYRVREETVRFVFIFLALFRPGGESERGLAR